MKTNSSNTSFVYIILLLLSLSLLLSNVQLCNGENNNNIIVVAKGGEEVVGRRKGGKEVSEVNCNCFVDSNSTFTLEDSCGNSTLPCSTIQQSIQSCGTSYNQITVVITPGEYFINTTSVFGVITNRVVNIINSNYYYTDNGNGSKSGSNNTDLHNTENENEDVIIDLTNSIGSFLYITPSESSDYSTIYINGITFQNGNSPYGSVIYNQGSWINVTIENSVFSNCTANVNGGSISMVSGTGNSGGGVGAINSTLSISNTIFNQSGTPLSGIAVAATASNGGVIFSNSTTLITIDNCQFINSTATNGGQGGIMYVGSGYLVMQDSIINYSGHPNSAFYLESMSGVGTGAPLFSFDNVVFQNSTNGVGFVIQGDVSTATFYQCTFQYNQNTTCISLVFSSSVVSIEQCTFQYNQNLKTTGNNGNSAILVESSSVSITDSTFQYNVAVYGGSILVNGSMPLQTVEIVNCEFNKNNATDEGGSIYSQNADVIIQNSRFTNNEAVSGSSVYCLNSKINFRNMTFTNNTDSAIPTPNGIGCGSGKVCEINGDQQFQNSCSYDYQPAKPSLLTPGQVAAIVVCVIIGAAGIAAGLILLVRKISRRNNYRPVGY